MHNCAAVTRAKLLDGQAEEVRVIWQELDRRSERERERAGGNQDEACECDETPTDLWRDARLCGGRLRDIVDGERAADTPRYRTGGDSGWCEHRRRCRNNALLLPRSYGIRGRVE